VEVDADLYHRFIKEHSVNLLTDQSELNSGAGWVTKIRQLPPGFCKRGTCGTMIGILYNMTEREGVHI
jgi:hypothetical protein